ncbi:MAG: polysaccharide biosynthesis protein, partial [Acidobacteria bacterium]|nr:polysaccharide biosynthesis protein [Acidobacteriota bacterium]
YDEIEIFLKNTCVLITGAGGSIGSEIAMQVCAFQPQKRYIPTLSATLNSLR